MPTGVQRLAGKVWDHPANQGRRVRQLARAVEFQIRGRVLRRPTVIRIGQRSKLLAYLDNGPSILAAYAPEPDFAEWQVWKRFLRKGDLFVDVGANVGIYSLLAAEVGAAVVAVEPDPSNLARLRHNLDLNGYDAEIWECALTESKTTLTFSDGLDSMNHITEGGGGRYVAGERFDDLVAGRRVRGMKVDVEGAERQVVAGALGSLRDGRIDLLQLEWNECARTNFRESRADVRALLDQVGFVIYRPAADGSLVPSDGSEGSDVFAGRPEVIAPLL